MYKRQRLDCSDRFVPPVDMDNEGISVEGTASEARGFVLNLDGTRRLYVGDSHVWSWYRGTSVGPYSAMSGLQAMERVIETWLDQGIPASGVVQILLEGCENLAVPDVYKRQALGRGGGSQGRQVLAEEGEDGGTV